MIRSCFVSAYNHVLPVAADTFRGFIASVGLDHNIDVEFTTRPSFCNAFYFSFHVPDPYYCLGSCTVDCLDDFDYLKSNKNFNFKEIV